MDDNHTQGRLSTLRGMGAMLTIGVGFLGLPLAGNHAAEAQTTKPIKVGALMSLTGGGAINGANGLTGAKMAISEINAAGGVNGRMLELVIGDDQSDPTVAVNEARRLAFSEKVDVVLGPLSSQLTLAVVPIFTEAKIAQVSTSGAAQLTPQFAPYGFSMNPSSEAQSTLMVQQITKKLGSKATGILIDNGAQTKSGLIEIKKFLGQSDTKITGEQEFQFRSEDKTPQLLSLKRSGAESLIIWANTVEDFGTILNNLQDIGWDVKMSGAIAETMFASPVRKIASADQLGKVASVAYLGWTYCPGDKVEDLPFVQFKKRLAAFEPTKFKDLAPTIVAWLYDGTYALKTAMASGAQTGPEIAAYIEKNSTTIKAVSGALEANDKSHFLVGVTGMTMVEDLATPGPEGLYRRTNCAK